MFKIAPSNFVELPPRCVPRGFGSWDLFGKHRQNKKATNLWWPFRFAGAPGEIRTPDLMVRSHALYPTELRARMCFALSVVSCPSTARGVPLPDAQLTTVKSQLFLYMAEREGFEPSMGF
jgi:hypothetical protein